MTSRGNRDCHESIIRTGDWRGGAVNVCGPPRVPGLKKSQIGGPRSGDVNGNLVSGRALQVQLFQRRRSSTGRGSRRVLGKKQVAREVERLVSQALVNLVVAEKLRLIHLHE